MAVRGMSLPTKPASNSEEIWFQRGHLDMIPPTTMTYDSNDDTELWIQRRQREMDPPTSKK